MDIIFWVVFLPILLLIGILLKGAMFLFHPLQRANPPQVQPEERKYSKSALDVIDYHHLDKRTIENVIRVGKKSIRHNGAAYRFANDNGVVIMVFTDKLGNIESIAM